MQNKDMARQTHNELGNEGEVKKDSRRAGVAHEELQEIADDGQRWKEGKKERVVVRRSGRVRRAPERY